MRKCAGGDIQIRALYLPYLVFLFVPGLFQVREGKGLLVSQYRKGH